MATQSNLCQCFTIGHQQLGNTQFAVIPKVELVHVMDNLREISNRWMAQKQDGEKAFSLGAAPFPSIESNQLSSLWNNVGGFLYDHREHFCHFEGLRSFKQKFEPTWTHSYFSNLGGLAAPRVL